jgi:hypothetical protein
LLKISIEVLVWRDVEHFENVALRIELVSEEKLLGADLELHDSNCLEGSRLRLPSKRFVDESSYLLIDLELRSVSQTALGPRESWCFDDLAVARSGLRLPSRHGTVRW